MGYCTIALLKGMVILYLLLHSSTFQSFLIKKIAGYLSKELNTTITIGSVDIRPFTSLVVNNVYIADLRGDTLLIADAIVADISRISFSEQKVNLSSLQLEDINFYLSLDSTDQLNMQFIIDKFSSDDPPDTSSANWEITCTEFSLVNSSFKFKTYDSSDTISGMDFANLNIQDINLRISELAMGDTIAFAINHLSLADHCGLKISGMNTVAAIHPKGIEVSKLRLLTNNSRIDAPILNFKFNEFSDFSDFLDSMNLSCTLDSSIIATEDLAYFVPTFDSISQKILFDGQINLGKETKGIKVTSAAIQTAFSKIYAPEISLAYKKADDLADFANRVKINCQLDSSKISTRDFALFSQDLNGLDMDMILSGLFTGKLNRLKGKDINISLLNQSVFRGDLNIDGITDPDNMFIHLDITELSTTVSDIERIPLPPFETKNNISLPESLSHLGRIKYKGNLTGFLSDFVAYGNFVTDLGVIKTDISLKQHSRENSLDFSGKLSMADFDIGLISDMDSVLGSLSMNADIKGTLSGKGKLQSKINSNIQKLEGMGYLYHDISISGDLTEETFNGKISCTDKNLLFDFNGRLNFSTASPSFAFNANIQNIDLFRLKIDTVNSLSTISANIDADFNGIDIDEGTGYLKAKNLNYKGSNSSFFLKKLLLNAQNTDSTREISINSDFIDLKIDGQFKVLPLIASTERIFHNILPSLAPSNRVFREKDSTHTFNFDISLKEIDTIANVFNLSYDGGFKTYGSTRFIGKIDTKLQDAELHITSPSLEYRGYEIEDLAINLTVKDKLMYLETKTENFQISEDLKLSNLDINFEGYNDTLLFDLHWINRDSLIYAGDIASLLVFKRNENSFIPSIEARMIPSELIFADEVWNLEGSTISIDSNSVKIEGFSVSKENQYLNIYGTLSGQKNDSIYVIFNEVNMENINLFTNQYGLTFKGIIQGKGSVASLGENPVFYANLDISNFNLNNQELGDIAVLSNWDEEEEVIRMRMLLRKMRNEPVSISGYYNPKTRYVDFVTTLEKFNMMTLQPYTDGILNNLKGRAEGEILTKGPISKPEITGKLFLTRTEFEVDYTKVSYNLMSNINISNNEISFEDMIISDENGKSAIAAGIITHNNFSDFKFDMILEANQFLFLKTNESDNSTYYGTAIASGLIGVTGDLNTMVIDITAKTEKNTRFFIPLSSSDEVGEFDFIKFIEKKTFGQKEEPEESISMTGLQLNFDLEVTPDAEVQIIFDSKVGDVIKSRGSANLKMEINTLGDFNMYGDYLIEKGDYLFTMQNIVNKRFDIAKGGTIKWNGSPYEAYADINAIYNTKAPLYDLMAGLSLDSAEAEKYRKRVPIECEMKLTETIMKPNIAFDINVPMADDKASSMISSLSEQERNRQLISLLILNRFYTPQSMRNETKFEGSGAVGVTSSELLSNQLSNWLSQISNDFDIGVNYRPGDEISSDELEVALSTQLFNDRISINGNVGMGGGQQNTSNMVGDFDVNVKLNRSGKIRLKAFTRSNEELYLEEAQYTQGIGLFYREDFNTVGELFRKYWGSITGTD